MLGVWLFLLPTLVFLAAFTYLPFGITTWEGLPALGSLLQRENLNALGVTALYTLLVVPLSVALGLLAAMAVEGNSRFRLLARALIFHPVILPTVAFAAVFLYLLNPLGPLQGTLRWLGLQNPLGDPLGAFLAVVSLGFAAFARSAESGMEWGLIAAGAVLVALPLVLGFLLFQRAFVEAFSRSRPKG